ncbi:MAG: GAK system ATP-grasp enzyme [Myxococcales bacterium]|nr:GAK system ATP-grasp enzyme [Myxococcales bacterium]
MQNKKIAVVGTPGGWSTERLADALAERTGFRCVVDMGAVVGDLGRGEIRYQDVDLCRLDGVIIKKISPEYAPDILDRLELLRFAESRGVKVFSAPEKVIRVLDRLACTVTLRIAGVAMPPTTITADLGGARGAVADYGAAVCKPLFSTKARGMIIVEDGPGADAELEAFQAAGNPVIYLQRKIPDLGRDLGVVFLGGEYVATYARVGAGTSWNTTIHDGGRYQAYAPSKEIIELARVAQAPFGLDFTCVDVVETSAGPQVFEVSAFGGFRGLLDAHGIDAAALYSDYVLGRV